ncbi:hypothetical protein [Actinosynnema sp. NPDC023587]|uniref:hypothetical protein n=1 Tax=Actinosynnema sp. NPDC023587 TaxID=3154695 RepID=UPI0033D22328
MQLTVSDRTAAGVIPQFLPVLAAKNDDSGGRRRGCCRGAATASTDYDGELLLGLALLGAG